MISLAWAFLAGCSLDIKPQTNWTDGAFYETDGQVQSLLEGAYVKFENALSVGFMVYGDIRSDLYRCHNENKVDYLNIMENVITPYNTHASWANFYASIQQLNLVIANAPSMFEAGIVDSAQFAKLMGEAYCLRAYNYFWIARVWGDAPIVLKPAVADDYNSRMKKSTQGELLSQVYSDLDKAREYLTDNGSRTHLTLSAAWAIEAQVCAWEKDWDGVLNACAKINDKQYELADLFDSTYSVGDISFMQNVANSEYARIFNEGNSSESIFELSFSLDDSSDSKQLSQLVASSEILRPNDALLEYYKTMNAFDWRYYINFYDNKKVTKYFINYGGIAEETRNIVLLRYAEIILLRAEAQIEKAVIEGGDTGSARIKKAVSDINTIRKRAGGEAYTLPGTYDLDNVDELRNALAEERKIEFYGEGYRYFDLVRTGKVIEVMEPINGHNDERSNVWPVYYTEVIYSNGSIEQNEYYK